jgi:hypothetical protein
MARINRASRRKVRITYEKGIYDDNNVVSHPENLCLCRPKRSTPVSTSASECFSCHWFE